MSTDSKRAPRNAALSAEQETPSVVRLSVNLAPTVAAALKSTAEKQGVTVTEATRRAVALLKLADDAHRKGDRLMVVEGEGDSAKYREIVMI